jgi:predicted lipid-binding transport protein (Tim44 family)
MSRLITLFLVALMASMLFVTQAEAKRFGGGKSFGYQRQNISQQAVPKAPSAQSPAAPASIPPSAGSRWLGPLAGLAAGGLLASLFMGHGFAGINFFDIALVLALAALILFVMRAMRRPQPVQSMGQVQYAGHGMPGPLTGTTPDTTSAGYDNNGSNARPSWFDEETFTRLAKGHFIRLQAANDAKDLQDIREYTTPEIFAEISLQMQERGDAPQRTEVMSVNAKVLDVVVEGELAIASVQFTGQIREAANGPLESFDEIWHVQRSQNQPNANWHIAGIQQTPVAMALSG